MSGDCTLALLLGQVCYLVGGGLIHRHRHQSRIHCRICSLVHCWDGSVLVLGLGMSSGELVVLLCFGSPLELARCAPLEVAVQAKYLVDFIYICLPVERRCCLIVGLLGIVCLLVLQMERWLGVLSVMWPRHRPLGLRR